MSRAEISSIRCEVRGSQYIPEPLGGGESMCKIFRDAAIPALARAGINPAGVSLTITVKSASLASASAEADGRRIPDQKVGTSDAELNPRAIEMLAKAVAQQLEALGQTQLRGADQ